MNSQAMKTSVLLILLSSVCDFVFAETPAISSLFPAGLQRGTTAELKLNGKPGTLPMQAWTSSEAFSDLQISEKGNALTLKASDDARPGLHWIRFHNPEGTTSLLPIYVGLLKEQAEAEPNNATHQANRIETLPATVNGILHKSGEVDTFAVSLEKGAIFTASIDSRAAFGSPMDAVLQILDKDGFVILQNDDDHGFDPLLSFKVPESSDYLIRVFCFPAAPNSSVNFAGGVDYIYRLSLTDSQYLTTPTLASSEAHATEPGLHTYQNILADAVSQFKTEQAADPEKTLILTEGIVSQPDSQPGEAASVTLTAKKGDSFRIQVLARQIASLLDPVLTIRKPDGVVHKEIDDSDREKRDVDSIWSAPADGDYQLEVTDRYLHAGPRFSYVLLVTKNEPRVELSVAADHFELKRDKPLEIEVTVKRISGFKEKLTVKLKNRPQGLSVSDVVSEEKGDSSKEVTLKLDGKTAEAFQGPIEIVALYQDGKVEVPVIANLKSMQQKTPQLWLTIPQNPEEAAKADSSK